MCASMYILSTSECKSKYIGPKRKNINSNQEKRKYDERRNGKKKKGEHSKRVGCSSCLVRANTRLIVLTFSRSDQK